MTSAISSKFSEMDFETSYDEAKDTDFSPKQESIDVAHDLVKDGKVSLENEDIPAAIEELSDACDIFASVFGESAPECAEAFYFYGKALLAMSRLENMVLDNAFEGVDIEEDSTEGEQVEGTTAMTKDEKLEIEDAVTDAFEENYDEHDRVARAHVFEDSEGSEASEDSDGSGTETEESEDEEMPTEAEQVEQEEVGDLQMAWEMLELAKNAWTKISTTSTGDMKKEVSANLSEVHLSLGEVSMDSGNYSQAQEDFTACIDLKKPVSIEAKISVLRSLAEAWYQLGVAQAYSGKFPEAETSLKNAVYVLQARKSSQPEEVEELEELVKEIGEEVAEHKTMEKEGLHYGPGGKLVQPTVAVGGLSHAAGPITGGSA